MKKEVRLLRAKAVNSLILSIEHFNRPSDIGRIEAVLILLDHAFEMLLKAAIRHKNGKIRKSREKKTIGFNGCVSKALNDGEIRFISQDQALTLQTINNQRGAAQHYLLEMSEQQLYFYAQAGVTLFKDIHDDIFGEHLVTFLPERVLPVSTKPPTSLTALFTQEIDAIKELLEPGTRRQMDAKSKLRSLAVLESAIVGDYEQPSDGELQKLCGRLASGEAWTDIFPGVSSIDISTEGKGPSINIRLTKKEGIPVKPVKEGEGGGAVIGVKRVNETDYYSLGFTNIWDRSGLGRYECLALIWKLGLQHDDDFFKEIRVGKARHKRYSPQTLRKIEECKGAYDLRLLVGEYRARERK